MISGKGHRERFAAAKAAIEALAERPAGSGLWFVLRPEIYDPKISMVTDEELVSGGVRGVVAEPGDLAKISAAKPGDWIAVRYGIAIKMGASILGDTEARE